MNVLDDLIFQDEQEFGFDDSEPSSTPFVLFGEVESVNPLVITIDGDEEPLEIEPSSTVNGILAGDRVQLILQDDELIVTGIVDGDVDYVQEFMDGIATAQDAIATLAEQVDAPINPPATPSAPTISDTRYQDAFGAWRARVNASWAAITTTTAGDPISISRYELWGAPVVSGTPGPWRSIATSEGTSVSAQPFDVGSIWRFAVVATHNGRPSSRSAHAEFTFGVDTTPPGQPAQPTAANYLGAVIVSWTGRDVSDAAMPSDFARCEVHASATSGFTPSAGTFKGNITPAGTFALSSLTIGATYYIRLVAYDAAGNASTPSAQRSAVAGGVLEGEIADGAITPTKLSATEVFAINNYAGPTWGNHTRMTPDGLTAWAPDPADTVVKPFARFGDGLAFGFDPNAPTARITGPGRATFSSVSTGALMVAGETLEKILLKVPQGIQGYAVQGSSSGNITTTETGVIELRAQLQPNRLYTLQAAGAAARSSVAGDIAEWNLRVAYDGAAVTTSSTKLRTDRSVLGPAGVYVGQPVIPAWLPSFLAPREARFLLTLVRYTGTGDLNVWGSSNQPLTLALRDEGPYMPPTDDRTKWVTTWNVANTWEHQTGSNLIPPGTEWRNGRNADGSEQSRVQLAFTGNSTSGQTGVTVATAMTGSTLLKAEVLLYFTRGKRGGISWEPRPGVYVSTQTTSSPAGGGFVIDSPPIPTPGSVWVDITSEWYAACRGVVVMPQPEPPGTGLVEAYGLSAGCRLRLTYLK